MPLFYRVRLVESLQKVSVNSNLLNDSKYIKLPGIQLVLVFLKKIGHKQKLVPDGILPILRCMSSGP